MAQRFHSFREFYPYYLAEHSDPRCRATHYVGSTLVLLILVASVALGQWLWLLWLPLAGYGCAWIGHFFFEHNKPATFKYPGYSLLGDWVMYFDFCRRLVTGKPYSGSR